MICGEEQLDLDVEVCTSHRIAVRKLLASPYQLIISSVHLAEIDDFFLLHRTQALAAGVPLVITAATGEKASARRALQQGAFDLLPTPLDHEQTVNTIRLALWHNNLNALIAFRSKALGSYRLHSTGNPGYGSDAAFRTILTSVEQSIVDERIIHQIRTSVKRATDLAKAVKTQAHELALKRLDRLSVPPSAVLDEVRKTIEHESRLSQDRRIIRKSDADALKAQALWEMTLISLQHARHQITKSHGLIATSHALLEQLEAIERRQRSSPSPRG